MISVLLETLGIDKEAVLSMVALHVLTMISLTVGIEKNWGGQSGIVSCISMHPTQPGTYAVGSYSSQGEWPALTGSVPVTCPYLSPL